MVAATHNFNFDFGRDGTYGHALADLSGYVISANWNEGEQAPYGELAPPCKLAIVLRNINGEFTNSGVGANVVTNGNMANFTVAPPIPDGWTSTTSTALAQRDPNGGAGTGAVALTGVISSTPVSNVSQACLIPGVTYKLTFTIPYTSWDNTATHPMGIQVMNGSTQVGNTVFAVGTYTFYFQATSATLTFQTNATLALAGSTYNITLDNITCQPCLGIFQPLLRLGTLGRFKLTGNGTTQQLFVGRLTAKKPTPGMASNRQITLEFTDLSDDLKWGDYKPTLQQSVTVDQAIQPVFDKAIVAFPYMHSYWMLGVAGASELGVNTYVYQTAAYTLDTCYTTLDFVGDNADTTGAGISPQVFISEELKAEGGGRFFFNPRTGKYTLHSRNRDTLNTTVAAVITDSDFESDKSMLVDGTDLENKTTISFQPRKVGTPGSIIWTASNMPVDIVAPDTYKTVARYQDQSNGNARIGAINVIPPQPGVDYTFAAASFYRRILLGAIINANTAELSFRHAVGYGTISLLTLQLRGTPITFYDPKSVTSLNGDSIRDNMLATNSLSIPAVSDEKFAQNYADYRTSKFGTPTIHYERIAFNANGSAARMSNALNLTVGSRITVMENWTGINADYFIVGAQHSYAVGGDNHWDVTLIVKTADKEKYWLLGVVGQSELGQTTKVAF